MHLVQARVARLVATGAMPILASLGSGASGDDEDLRFSHLTFQEYLVAAEISERVQRCAAPERPAVLRRLLRQGDRPF